MGSRRVEVFYFKRHSEEDNFDVLEEAYEYAKAFHSLGLKVNVKLEWEPSIAIRVYGNEKDLKLIDRTITLMWKDKEAKKPEYEDIKINMVQED
jgi:hypothetical protein